MPRKRISRIKVKNAIPGSGGIITHIAKRTGYSWLGVYKFIKNDPELLEMLRNEEEGISDMAESVLISKIRDGDEAVARWWLAHRRRHIYGDNLDLNASGAITIRVVREDDAVQADDGFGDSA